MKLGAKKRKNGLGLISRGRTVIREPYSRGATKNYKDNTAGAGTYHTMNGGGAYQGEDLPAEVQNSGNESGICVVGAGGPCNNDDIFYPSDPVGPLPDNGNNNGSGSGSNSGNNQNSGNSGSQNNGSQQKSGKPAKQQSQGIIASGFNNDVVKYGGGALLILGIGYLTAKKVK